MTLNKTAQWRAATNQGAWKVELGTTKAADLVSATRRTSIRNIWTAGASELGTQERSGSRH